MGSGNRRTFRTGLSAIGDGKCMASLCFENGNHVGGSVYWFPAGVRESMRGRRSFEKNVDRYF